MARPEKQGLDYFSHDVDLSTDEKIQLIEADYNVIGYAVYCKLLERIYRNGYFIKCDEKFVRLFAKNTGIKPDLCRNIINSCTEEDLFKKKLYDEYNILTSEGIQKRFIKAVERRKSIDLIENYLLLM